MYHFVVYLQVSSVDLHVCVPVKHSYVHQIRTQGLSLTGDMVYSRLREVSVQAAWSCDSPDRKIINADLNVSSIYDYNHLSLKHYISHGIGICRQST